MNNLYQTTGRAIEFKRLLIGLLSGVLLLSFLLFGIYYNLKRENQLSQWTLHTQEDIYLIEKTISLAKDYETSARGFIITDQEKYIKPLTAAEKELDLVFLRLESLNADDPAQQALLDSLSYYVRKKVDFSNLAIKVLREEGLPAASDLIINKNSGMVYMEKVRQIAETMHSHEARVLNLRKRESEKASLITNKIIVTCLALFILLLSYIIWRSWRQEKERKAAVEKLKQREEHFRALIEHTSEAILLSDNSFSFFYCSPAAERILGWTKEEITTEGFRLKYHPEDEPQVQKHAQAIFKAPGNQITTLVRVQHKEGHFVWLEGETSNLLHQDSVQAIVSNFKDVSSRIHSEEEVKNAHRQKEKTTVKLNRIMASSLDVICTIDAEGRFEQVSSASEAIWGYKPEELVGKMFMDLVSEEDKDITLQVAKSIMDGSPVTTFENRYVRPDGTLAPVLWSAKWDIDDQLMYCAAKDAREKKQLEEAFKSASEQIRQSEAALLEAQRIAKTGSWNLHLQTQQLYCSEELYNIFGANKDNFDGSFPSFLSFVDQDQHALAWETTTKAATDGEPFEIQYHITTGRGERKIIQIIGASDINQYGLITRLFGTAQDITERKHFETALLASEEKYKLLFYQAPLPKWIYDLETLRILDVNESAIQHYGYTREEFLGMTAQSLLPDADEEALIDSLQQNKHGRGKSELGLWNHIKKDKSLIKVEISGHNILFENKECLLIDVNDVTEKTKVENSLKESIERWEILSKVTYDAIWDWDIINNVLVWGDTYKTLFGYDKENSTGNFQNWDFYLHPDDRQRVNESLHAFLQGHETIWQQEYRKLRKNGEYAFCTDRGILLRDKSGVPYRMIGALRDITESKISEENLLAEKTFSEALIEATPDAIVGIDESGDIIIFNDRAERLFGYKQAEILGSPLLRLLPSNVQEKHQTRRQNFFADPTEQKLKKSSREILGMRKNGSEFPADVRLNMLQSQMGQIVIASIRDITKRKQAELQLKESEKNLKAILSSSQEAIYLLDVNLRLVLLNEHARSLTSKGFKVDCKSGDDFTSVFDPALNEKLKTIYLKVLAGENVESERLIPLPEGDAFYCSNYFPVKDNEGNIIGICCSSKNITERKKIEAAMNAAYAEKEEYQYRFKAILDYSPQAILIKDLEGKFIFSNKAFLNLFDIDQSHEVTYQLKDAFNDQVAREEFLAAKESGNTSGIIAKEWKQQIKLSNGEIMSTEIIKFPLYDRQKQLFGICTICKDISEQMKHQQQLIQARENAEKAERLQEQFLANMSHELRTPMNGIIGTVNLLLTSSSIQLDQKVQLKVIKRSSDTLLTLINDILDLSKIKAGMLTLEKVNFDFNESITGTALMFKEKAREKEIKLSVTSDPFIPRLLSGDPHRLNQILNNLLSNAVKFTEKGTIRLEATLLEENSEQAIVEFVVSDTGIGIDANSLQLIFNNFAQASSDISSKYGGTGLGLAITKRLIEMQGGEIKVESKKGMGTTFKFHLPYTITKDNDAVVAPYHHSSPVLVKKFYKGKRALIVEDNDINQVVLASSLKQYNLDFKIANNGQAAIDLLEAGDKFDIIFMDLRMPVMDGFQTTAYIRQKLLLNTPIVVLTASVLRNERERCLELGASEYMAKPFAMTDLARSLDLFLTDHALPIAAPSTPTATAAPLRNKSAKDFDITRLLEVEDPDFIREIFALFLEKVPPYLQELKESFNSGDCPDFLEKAHKLKGSFSSVHIEEIYHLIEKMEEKVKTETSLAPVEEDLTKCLTLYESLVPALTQEVEKQLLILELKS